MQNLILFVQLLTPLGEVGPLSTPPSTGESLEVGPLSTPPSTGVSRSGPTVYISATGEPPGEVGLLSTPV